MWINRIVFTFTVLLLSTGSAIAEIVTIDALLLPLSPQWSYAHCWAAATNSTTNHVPFPGGKTSVSGSDITCNANKSHGGNSATAHSRARVTGGVLLEATVNASKVTFAAAAAYAQGGGQVRKQGINKSSLMTVYISGLKVSGFRATNSTNSTNSMTKVTLTQINNTLLDVRVKRTAKDGLVVTVSAPLLCDAVKIKNAGVDVRHLSSSKNEMAVSNVLDHVQRFCGSQKNFVVRTSGHVGDMQNLEFVIVIPDNKNSPDGNDFSVNTAQFIQNKEARDELLFAVLVDF